MAEKCFLVEDGKNKLMYLCISESFIPRLVCINTVAPGKWPHNLTLGIIRSLSLTTNAGSL
jgi:hypothetical protein